MNFPALLMMTCIVLLGCSPATVKTISNKAGAEPLAPAAVLSLVEANTLFIHAFEEDSYLYFDSSATVFARDIYANKDSGRWDVSEDGELCLRMKKWWYGDLRCFLIHGNATQEKIFLTNSSGVVAYSAERFTGDKENLYFVLKKKNKSYRRSLRSQENTSTAGSETQSDNKQNRSSSANTEPAVADSSPAATGEKKDLRSTVKWMARDCEGCNLAHTDLTKADLVGAQLAGANLRGANLQMANLRRANLQGANLRNAVLDYANLPGANLRDADLRNAKLKGANLIRADLTGADLTGADLTGALVEGTTGLP